ncbi:MAG: carboxypeptidase-like regulatory domain-containing protein [Bacteroidota bacterium]
MKTTLATFILLLLCSIVWGQSEFTLRGTISIDGEDAIGAKIILVGTEIGTYSDANGYFSLSSPNATGKLSVSLLGAVSQIIDFDPQTNRLAVELETQAIDMEAIEIIGYRPKYNITDIVCGFGRCCNCARSIASMRIEENFMSDPSILNGNNPQLNITRQGDDILPRFNQAPLGSQANLSFNGMPLDQKASDLFLFLWESDQQHLISQSPNESILTQGSQSIGGNLSFGNGYINAYEPNIRYQSLAGLGFANGETNLSHQEHHIQFRKGKHEHKFKIRGGLDYLSRPNYQSESQWQMYAAKMNINLSLDKINWQSNLLSGSIQNQGPKTGESTHHLAIISQKLSGNINERLSFQVDQLSQLSHQLDSLRQFHALRASVDYANPNWSKFSFDAQYDFQQSQEQQGHAFTGGATYRLPKEMALKAGIRQEQYFSSQETQGFGATIISASIGRRENHCAPSRMSFRYETAALFLNQNRAWLNSLTTTWELIENGKLRLEGRLHANRFAERQAVDLCWLQWDGQGNQTQIGGSIGLRARHSFGGSGFSIYNYTSYSYNQSMIDPFDPTTAANSRSGSAGGHPSALVNELPLPKGTISSFQIVQYEAWSLSLNAWAWLQNGASASLANGLRLQETRLAWKMPTGRLPHKVKAVKCSLQGNNLLQWTDGNQQEFDQMAARYTQASFNPIASGRQLLLGLEVQI